MLKRLKVSNPKRIALLFLGILFVLSFIYSYSLAFKRYQNFEYGKFDLGNMSQIVWNSAHGRIMEVTDQFGTNMPRWGMSHVDPILLIFVPIYWVYAHPMVLVFFQQLLILSAIFPIFLLVYKKTKNSIAGVLVALTYVLYPAIGFTLVWTGFHGISFVAPLLIWLVWFLEKRDFLVSKSTKKTDKVIYWVMIVLMLMGKEEIGAILAIACVFLYFKNKKLAIYTFIVSVIWFVVAFFVIIPKYAHLREESINQFVEYTKNDDVNSEGAGEENFFFIRYSYLGNSYPEMIQTVITRPGYVINKTITEDKVIALNGLIGPLGYITVLSPFWIVSTPDLAITLLSKDEILDISNHRIAFVISALFISYVYLLSFIYKKLDKKQNFKGKRTNTVIIAISGVILVFTLVFSDKYQNPLYVSGKSLIENKIIKKVFAEELKETEKNTPGYISKAAIPRNDKQCLDQMVSLINFYNPEIYTGPDYLGAHSSSRWVNALFPARYWDADFVITDVFETKTVNPLESTGWTFNKEGLRKMMDLNRYQHIYSCGQASAFALGENKDNSYLVTDEEFENLEFPLLKNSYILDNDRIKVQIHAADLPQEYNTQSPTPIRIIVSKEDGNFHDKMAFWIFENVQNEDDRHAFVDYLTVGSRQNLDVSKYGEKIMETYYPRFRPNEIASGKYKVYYGVGDTLNAKKVYLGDMEIKSGE